MNGWLDSFTNLLASPLALLGFAGQALFFSRWIVQWVSSEKHKRSHVPIAFWWISLGGGLMLLTYAFLRGDPVFIAGQLVGIANYSRNLMLRHGSAASNAMELANSQSHHPA